tara:strand:+ start:2587 stop:3663 length:1077 start_codon:yes stop_codon:yes gene_type:complete
MLNKISINKDISIAKTMPSYYYIDDDYYNSSIENIFKNSWQFIINANSLKSKIYPFTFLKDSVNEPLLLISEDNHYRCLSNVCTHRGNLLYAKESNSNNIRCEYHGRIFDFKGKFLSCPGFKNVKNFPSKEDDLNKIELKVWNNFIFTSLNQFIDISDVLEDIDNRLGWYPFNKLRYDESCSNTYQIDANWAIYCENYLEGFHVPFVHQGLNKDIKFDSYITKVLDNGVLQYTLSKTKKDALSIPSGFTDSNKDVYAYYYWLFPNLMLNFYSWGLSVNIIEPISKNKTRIRFLSYPIADSQQPLDTDSSLDKVEEEDQNIVLNVQQGLNSKFYNRGRYSSDYEIGVHHFHRLICKAIN